jgi:hypothetical protein
MAQQYGCLRPLDFFTLTLIKLEIRKKSRIIFSSSDWSFSDKMSKTQTHTGHDKHLCYLTEQNTATEKLKPLVENPKYICKSCGRAAAKAENLCSPEPL